MRQFCYTLFSCLDCKVMLLTLRKRDCLKETCIGLQTARQVQATVSQFSYTGVNCDSGTSVVLNMLPAFWASFLVSQTAQSIIKYLFSLSAYLTEKQSQLPWYAWQVSVTLHSVTLHYYFRCFHLIAKIACHLCPVRPFVQISQRGSHWTDFREIWHRRLLWKSAA
jgi:hypothetical protein